MRGEKEEAVTQRGANRASTGAVVRGRRAWCMVEELAIPSKDQGAGQNEACWPHWAEGEMAGGLGTTGAESVAGKASSAIPAVVPEQEQGRGCREQWQT